MFNNKEYMKEYRKRPENRERKRELSKKYRREMSPEKKEERSLKDKKRYQEKKEELSIKRKKLYKEDKEYREKVIKQRIEYRNKNRERIAERAKEYRKNNEESIRNQKLIKKFGIGVDEYNLLLESQNYKCAICGSKETGSHHTKYFSVDHDHKTGKVRGFLCLHCNTGIGSLLDNPILLSKAIDYLQVDRGS